MVSNSKKIPYFVSVDNLVKNASQFNIQMQLLKDNRYALKKNTYISYVNEK